MSEMVRAWVRVGSTFFYWRSERSAGRELRGRSERWRAESASETMLSTRLRWEGGRLSEGSSAIARNPAGPPWSAELSQEVGVVRTAF